MPRLQKSLLQKKWLGAKDVFKVLEDGRSKLIEMFAVDKSNEMTWKYAYKCTFSPKMCNTVISRHKQQVFVQQQMQEHLQGHITHLSRASPDDQEKFITRNNLYKEGAPRQKRKADKSCESSQAKYCNTHETERMDEAVPCSSGLSKTNKGAACSKQQNSKNDEEKELYLHGSDSTDSLKQDDYALTSSSEFQNNGLPEHIMLINQTMKSYETAKYKVAKTLLDTLPKEWEDIPKLLDSCIKKVGIAKEDITERERENMLWAMDIYVKSHKKSEEIKNAEAFDPLTENEKKIMHSVSTEEWARLGSATDEESERQFKLYAALLEREYFNSPIKLKKCRHCNKTFTASTSLIQHIQSISGKRFWFCWDCLKNGKNASFTRKTSCQYHILNKTGIERFRCGYDGCSSKLDHPHHMKFHIFDHQGWKAYLCKYNGCKERFNSKNALKRHMTKDHPNISNHSGIKPHTSETGLLVRRSGKDKDIGAGITRLLEDQARLLNESSTVKEDQGDIRTENADTLWEEESPEENDCGESKKDQMDQSTAGISQNKSHHSFSDLLKAIEIVEQNANRSSTQVTDHENVDIVSPNLSPRNVHNDFHSPPQPTSSVLTTSPVATRREVLSESRSYSQRQNQRTAIENLDSSPGSTSEESDELQNQSIHVQMV